MISSRIIHQSPISQKRGWCVAIWIFTRSILFACLGGGFANVNSAQGEPSSFPPLNAVPATTTNRTLEETELVALLTDVLQRDYVKSRGELEIKFTRPWTARQVPDALLKVRILDLPNVGVTPSCIVRFALDAGDHKIGEWQAPVQAHIWREVWVANAGLQRGQNLIDAEIARERRDVINQREPLAEFTERDSSYEFAEPVSRGAMVLARSLKLKPVIHRGQLADALVEAGSLRISLKVEALEDGSPGQMIRARNPYSRRDLRGKVLNEQTIVLSL